MVTSSELWRSNDKRLWLRVYSQFSTALTFVSTNKPGKQLDELNEWLRIELPAILLSRSTTGSCSGMFITLEELKKIMLWKITRGKFRPLMNLVGRNNDALVERVTKKAFEYLDQKKYADSLKEVMQLKGIGVATASAILGIVEKDEFPFMSDVAFDACTNMPRKYDVASYYIMKIHLETKAGELGGDWTSQKVGECLWIAENISKMDDSASAVLQPINTTGKRKLKT